MEEVKRISAVRSGIGLSLQRRGAKLRDVNTAIPVIFETNRDLGSVAVVLKVSIGLALGQEVRNSGREWQCARLCSLVCVLHLAIS